MPNSLIPIALDFDGSLPMQTTFWNRLARKIDLRHIEDLIRLRADASGVAALRMAIAQLPADPSLTFIGSGDFHHVSLARLESLARDHDNFALVLIDNHPDWFAQSPTFHCGNWVSGALKLPQVSRLTLIGQDSADLRGDRWRTAPLDEIISRRVQLHPLRRQRVRAWRFPFGKSLRLVTVRQAGVCRIIADLTESIAGKKIYISIDKDCLSPEFAATDWEQGGLMLDEVIEMVLLLREKCQLIGADICGERAATPLKGIFKRLDAGRLFFSPPIDEKSIRMNEQTNLRLLSAFVE